MTPAERNQIIESMCLAIRPDYLLNKSGKCPATPGMTNAERTIIKHDMTRIYDMFIDGLMNPQLMRGGYPATPEEVAARLSESVKRLTVQGQPFTEMTRSKLRTSQ